MNIKIVLFELFNIEFRENPSSSLDLLYRTKGPKERGGEGEANICFFLILFRKISKMKQLNKK